MTGDINHKVSYIYSLILELSDTGIDFFSKLTRGIATGETKNTIVARDQS